VGRPHAAVCTRGQVGRSQQVAKGGGRVRGRFCHARCRPTLVQLAPDRAGAYPVGAARACWNAGAPKDGSKDVGPVRITLANRRSCVGGSHRQARRSAALTELARELRERPSPPVERALVSLELALGNCTSSPRKRAQAVSAEQVTAWTAARSKLRAGPLLGQSMNVSAVELPLKVCLESARASSWVALHDALPTSQSGTECIYSTDPIFRPLLQHELLTLGLWLTGNEGGVSLLSKADARELSILVHTYPDRARTLAAFAARP
jgi:hypothetical protein